MVNFVLTSLNTTRRAPGHRRFFPVAVFALSLLPIVCSAFQSNAQTRSIDWGRVHTVTMDAINDLYNLRYAEAEKHCNEVIQLAPGDPRGHFFKAMIYYKQYNSNKNDTAYKKFIHYSEKLVKTCEALLERNEKDDKALFYMGGILGYRGLTRYFRKDMTGAVWDGKKGFDYLEEALELDPANTDAQMGFGLMNYLVSQAPSYLSPALKLAGLSGDRVKGLKQLENAAARGIYTRAEARLWLSDFYSGEDNATRSNYHLSAFVSQYPENYWQRLQLAQLNLYSLHKCSEAIAQYTQLLERTKTSNSDAAEARAWAQFGLGTANQYLNNFPEAIRWLEMCASSDVARQYTSEIRYQIGLCYELNGNRKEAEVHYRQAGTFEPARIKLGKPMTKEDIAGSKLDNLLRAGEFDRVISSVDSLLDVASAPPAHNRAFLQYCAGRANFEKGSYRAAADRFRNILSLSLQEDTWLLPHAAYRLGLSNLKLNDKPAAKQSFEKGLSYREYDNEESLRQRLERELDKL
jgi:Flp pilus assembly protein TadD